MSNNTKNFRSFYRGDDPKRQVSDARAENKTDEKTKSANLIDMGNAQVTVPNKDGQKNSGLRKDANVARPDASNAKATEASKGKEDQEMIFVNDGEDPLDPWDPVEEGEFPFLYFDANNRVIEYYRKSGNLRTWDTETKQYVKLVSEEIVNDCERMINEQFVQDDEMLDEDEKGEVVDE